MEYEIVIGLEVHAELSTKSKIYCSCTTEFGGEPNTHCCPVCTGMPGTLPVLNKSVVEYAVKAGLATNCSIAGYSRQDRKNYFYPDLPKAYQISQLYHPLCVDGFLNIERDDINKRIGIKEIHIEEDAGKLMHEEPDEYTLVDYNRCGVPLIEIVSCPDMRSAEEARVYLESLKAILQYAGVSDCKMQEGSLRADVNVSVRPLRQKEYGIRTEMKNMNSFRAIVRAIESESMRQIGIIEAGGSIAQETRRWDDSNAVSYPMRSKEEAHDYRYFPEPDLVPVAVDNEWVKKLKASLPELPDVKKKRYMSEYGLPEYDASMLTSSIALARFFEKAAEKSSNVKAVSNWMMGDLMRILKERELEVKQIPFPPEYLAKLAALIEEGIINGTIAKKVFEEMFDSGEDPEVIVKAEGLAVISDEDELLAVVRRIIQRNQQPVSDYRKGKERAIGFLTGQAMKEMKGKADPQMINKLLKEELDKV